MAPPSLQQRVALLQKSFGTQRYWRISAQYKPLHFARVAEEIDQAYAEVRCEAERNEAVAVMRSGQIADLTTLIHQIAQELQRDGNADRSRALLTACQVITERESGGDG